MNKARQGGFTLIEVLVSLLILAVLAGTAWKGVDGISTARQVADGNLKRTLRMQSVMTQFEADVSQVMETYVADGLQFDGAHLRMTRRIGGGMQVVVWYLQNDRLLRWASPVTIKVGELQKYWMSSYLLQGRETGTLTALKGVSQWQVYCFRGGTVSNCQSSGDVASKVAASKAAAAAAQNAGTPSGTGSGASGKASPADVAGATAAIMNRQLLPDAIRAQIAMGEGSGFNGSLLRDLMLGPHQ
jgi:general secretion pathway protein J